MANFSRLGDGGAGHTGRPAGAGSQKGKKKADSDRFEGLRNALQQARSVILRELSQQGTDGNENFTEVSADVFDLSASELERNMSLLLKERGRSKLRAVEDALERMDQGTFGICEDCGCEIPLGRLEVMPFAATCRDCKAEQEKRDKLFASTAETLFASEPEERGPEWNETQ